LLGLPDTRPDFEGDEEEKGHWLRELESRLFCIRVSQEKTKFSIFNTAAWKNYKNYV